MAARSRANKPETIDAQALFLTPEEIEAQRQLPARQPSIPEFEEEDAAEWDDVTAMNNIMAELGGSNGASGYANIYREEPIPGGRKKRVYMGKLDASNFVGGGFVEEIKQQFGAGDYEISVYAAGHRGVYKKSHISIARDPAAVGQVSAAPDNTAAIVAAIEANGDRTLQAILALAQANQSPQASTLDKLQELKMMADIFKSNAPAAQPVDFSQFMAMFKLGAEMASNGAGDGDNAWASKMIDTFGKPMLDMITSPAVAPAGLPARRPNPQPRIAPPAQPKQPATATQEQPGMNPLMAFFLNQLKSKAARDLPVEPEADDILNRLQPAEADQLVELIGSDDWREKIARFTSAANEYPDWFGRLRDTVLKYHAEDKLPVNQQVSGVVLTTVPAGAISPVHDSQQSDTKENPD